MTTTMTAPPADVLFEEVFEILLFGALKDAAHAERINIGAPSTLSIAQLLEALAAQHPSIQKYLPHVRVAVNCEYSALDQQIKRGDEIALLPPVAGGCNDLSSVSFMREVFAQKLFKKY